MEGLCRQDNTKSNLERLNGNAKVGIVEKTTSSDKLKTGVDSRSGFGYGLGEKCSGKSQKEDRALQLQVVVSNRFIQQCETGHAICTTVIIFAGDAEF